MLVLLFFNQDLLDFILSSRFQKFLGYNRSISSLSNFLKCQLFENFKIHFEDFADLEDLEIQILAASFDRFLLGFEKSWILFL